MSEKARESLLAAIEQEVCRSGVTRKRFVDAVREELGWRGSYRQASCRVSEWFDPANIHRLPAEVLPVVVRITGSAAFCDELLALEARMQRKRRSEERPLRLEVA